MPNSYRTVSGRWHEYGRADESVTFAGAPRVYPQKPGYYERETDRRETTLKDRGLILTRIVEAGGEIPPAGMPITLEEYYRRDVQWTQAMYNELYGEVADHRGEAIAVQCLAWWKDHPV